MLDNEGIPLHEGPGRPLELQSAISLDSSRGPSGLVLDLSWQNHAACKGMDINLFYLGQGKKTNKEVFSACNSCPVSDSCLQHALEHEEYGHWANTNPKQREALRQELGITLKTINSDFMNMQNEIERTKIAASIPKIKGRGSKKKAVECELD